MEDVGSVFVYEHAMLIEAVVGVPRNVRSLVDQQDAAA
jgi:hypothetical protein